MPHPYLYRGSIAFVRRRRDDGAMNTPPAADFLALSDRELLAQCREDRFRASGPGGQHRNKTDTAVRLHHHPTGLSAEATEHRSQAQNRAQALRRLRRTIAVEVRRPVDPDAYAVPPALAAMLPGAGRDQLGPHHPRYWAGVQALLDLLAALDGVLAGAAAHLGLSSGVLSRTIRRDPALTRAVNDLRARFGLRPLR